MKEDNDKQIVIRWRSLSRDQVTKESFFAMKSNYFCWLSRLTNSTLRYLPNWLINYSDTFMSRAPGRSAGVAMEILWRGEPSQVTNSACRWGIVGYRVCLGGVDVELPGNIEILGLVSSTMWGLPFGMVTIICHTWSSMRCPCGSSLQWRMICFIHCNRSLFRLPMLLVVSTVAAKISPLLIFHQDRCKKLLSEIRLEHRTIALCLKLASSRWIWSHMVTEKCVPTLLSGNKERHLVTHVCLQTLPTNLFPSSSLFS